MSSVHLYTSGNPSWDASRNRSSRRLWMRDKIDIIAFSEKKRWSSNPLKKSSKNSWIASQRAQFVFSAQYVKSLVKSRMYVYVGYSLCRL